MAPVPDQRIHVSMDQQQRLHELETAFIASPRHAVSVRRDLNKAWPQLEYSFEELSEAMDSDIRAAAVCTKLTGVAGHLLDTTRGRQQLIQWREAGARAAMLVIGHPGLPESSRAEMVHDAIGHFSYLGYLHFTNGNFEGARKVLEHTLALGNEYNVHSGDTAALTHLAFIDITEEKYDDAIERLHRVMELDGENNANAHLTLGVAYERQHQREMAHAEYNRAINLLGNDNDPLALATALVNRAGNLVDTLALENAAADLDRAERIIQQMGSPAHLGLLKANQARLEIAKRPEDATHIIQLLEESIGYYVHVGDQVQIKRSRSMLESLYNSILREAPNRLTRQQRKVAYGELINLAVANEDFARTLQLCQGLLKEIENEGDEEVSLQARAQMAHCYTKLGQYESGRDTALAVLPDAIDYRAAHPEPILDEVVRSLHWDLGQCFRRLHDAATAERHYRKALALAEGNTEARVQLQGNLALVLADRHEYAEAVSLARSLVHEFANASDLSLASLARFNLAHILYQSGDVVSGMREGEVALRLLQLINDPNAEEIRRQMAEWSSPSPA